MANLETIPVEHMRELLNGRIPDEYCDEFLDMLNDNIRERFGRQFARGVVPRPLVDVLKQTTIGRRTKDEL